MPLSPNATSRLLVAVGDTSAGNEVVTAINNGAALAAAQSTWAIANVIVATAVSQTTDFGSLKVGDQVLMIPATAGNSDLITVATIGDLGQAAVVGNIYLVLRAFSLPAPSAATF